MGKSKKKIDVFSIVIFAVLVLAVVMAIVGVCIAWTAATSTVGSSSKTTTTTLADWAKSNADLIKINQNGYEGFGVMQAFAYITLALACLTAIVFVVSKFANIKVLKWVLIGVSALLVISAIVTIATTYGFCGKLVNGNVSIGGINLASAKSAPAAGAWLLTVFGILGGAAGVVGALKK